MSISSSGSRQRCAATRNNAIHYPARNNINSVVIAR